MEFRLIKRHSLNEKYAKYIFLVIVLIYLALQSVNLGHRWVDDESWYLMPLPSIYQEGSFRIPTVPGDDVFWPQPPLLTYMEAVLGALIDLDSVTARLIPLSFGVLLLVATYLLCIRQFGWLAAIISTAIVAADNILFLTARTVRPDIMVAAFQVLAMLFFFRAASQSFRGGDTVLASLMAALAVASHPNGLLVPASLFFMTLLMVDSHKDKFLVMIKWGLWFALFVFPFIFWLLWLDYDHGFENVISHWTGRHGRFSDAGVDQGALGKAWAMIVAEVQGRYMDFMQWPYRIHIAVVSVGAILLSFFSKQQIVRTLGVVVAFHLFFFIFINNSNNSIRYLATCIPVVAILIGYYISTLIQSENVRNYLVGVVLIVVVAGSQFAGNAVFLWKFKGADYSAVVTELREHIEPGETVYGGMSFWLGFQDMTYVPYMRMSWERAVKEYKPTYVIMDDWVMMGGWQSGEWKPLRTNLNKFLDTNATLVSKVNNNFYGELKLYRVDY